MRKYKYIICIMYMYNINKYKFFKGIFDREIDIYF